MTIDKIICREQLPTKEQWSKLRNLALELEEKFFGGNVDSFLTSLGYEEQNQMEVAQA
jgi:hypothetical protein